MRPFAPSTLCLAIATAALAATPAAAQIVDSVVKDRAAPASPSDPQNLWLLDLSTVAASRSGCVPMPRPRWWSG